MLALVAAILLAVYSLGGSFDEVHLGWLGLAFLATHHVLGEWSPWRRSQ